MRAAGCAMSMLIASGLSGRRDASRDLMGPADSRPDRRLWPMQGRHIMRWWLSWLLSW